MSDGTGIEWTDATWNPVTGCTKVSPGCDNCYAETFAERFRGKAGHYFEQGFDMVERPDKVEQPLRWTKPRKIFVNSMSDLFHDSISDAFIARVFAVMAATPHHTYQLLTKRHGRMRSLLSDPAWRSDVFLRESVLALKGPARPLPAWPLPNLWVGVSVEDQKRADLRIPALLATPAAVRWLSMEPLLGPVDLTGLRWERGNITHLDVVNGWYGQPGIWREKASRVDWVVVGGESGPGARPMHPAWARSLRDQCVAAGVPFHFKQWGQWAHGADGNLDYRRHIGFMADGQQFADPFNDIPGEILRDPVRFEQLAVMRSIGKKLAGRELDGRTWDEYPAVDRA